MTNFEWYIEATSEECPTQWICPNWIMKWTDNCEFKDEGGNVYLLLLKKAMELKLDT
jgi:hypothetical protein